MHKLKTTHLTSILLTILVTCIVLPGLVQAVDYTVGVKAGDWVKYGQFSVTWTGNGTAPSYIEEEKKMDWVKLEVENVSGTTVNINMTLHFNNGTQIYQISSVNLNSTASMGSRLLIAANLNSGDPLSPEPNSPTINQTITRTYASASRNVNLLNATTVYQNQTTTLTVYFDKSTGFMVEMYVKGPDYTTPGAYVETTITATETNIWSPDLIGTLTSNIIYIIIGAVAIVAVIAAAIALRRKKPSPQQPTPPQATETKATNQ